MHRKRIFGFIAFAALSTVLISGCDEKAEGASSPFTIEHINVDGRSIPCIIWQTYDAWKKIVNFGISCDWAAQ